MWIPLSVVFFLGLVDRRRIRSWHTARPARAALVRLLAALLQPRPHLHERVARRAAARVPPRAHVVDRLPRPRLRTRRSRGRSGCSRRLAVFLGGLRIGLNLETPHGVIDVGFAGVIGGDRILDGQAPYGHMPDDRGPRLRPCRLRGRRSATTSRRTAAAKSANARGDTYGPIAYLAYVPAVLTLGWSGKWDSLPAAHATAIAFDLLVVLGLFLVGRRFGGTPLGVALAFGWVAFPFTAYAMNSNSNDAIMPAILVWGFWLCDLRRSPGVRRSRSPAGRSSPRCCSRRSGSPTRTASARAARRRFAVGFVVATLAVFSILLLEPSLDARRCASFVDRTIGYQLDRDSPFSPWDWGQYHARGIPDLHAVQVILAGRRPRARRRRRGDPAAQGPARARRAERCRARRLRARRSPTGRTSTSRGSCRSSCSRCCCRGASRRCREPTSEPALEAARRRRRSRRDHAHRVPRAGRGGGCARRRPRRREPRGRPGDHRHARLPDLRRADRERRRALPRLRGRVPAGRAGAVRRARARHVVAATATTRPSRR